MPPIVKNIFAVVGGWLVGSAVNMGLVQVGYSLFPIPGLDPENLEALGELMPTLGAEHFIFPFLAHALGTLVGAFVAAKIAATHQMQMAFVVGGIFLIGGIAVNMMLPGPLWFTVADLVLAYVPMAWIGGRLGKGGGN